MFSRVQVLLASLLLLSRCCSSTSSSSVSRVSAKQFDFRRSAKPPDEALARIVRFAQEDDTAECYSALMEADMIENRKISSTEYVDFIHLLSPEGFLEGVTKFAELPFILKINFGSLACLCQRNGGDQNCCQADNAHISNAGAAQGETPTPQQEQYLFAVCSLTETAINRIISSQSPSLAPVLPPSDAPSPSPTARPTLSPTSRPTFSPSVAPTVLASDGPTNASDGPTNAPSSGPTNAPSSGPTNAPSSGPTVSPTALISGHPTTTQSPTTSPTVSPSKNPTPIPSGSPTKSPQPSLGPTGSPTTSPSTTPTTSTVPSSQPSVQPTNAPTFTPAPTVSVQPSDQPTVTSAPSSHTPSMAPSDALEPDQVSRTIFLVGLREGNIKQVTFDMYVPDLITSLNIVAVNVSSVLIQAEAGTNATTTRRLLRSTSTTEQQQPSRRLQINVQYPTNVDGLTETICPAFVQVNDRCEDIIASVGIFCKEEDETTTMSCEDYASSMATGLETAILEGQLQKALAEVNPDSPASILTGVTGPDGLDREISTDDEGLSAGAVTGLVAVGVVAILVTAILFMRRSNKRGREQQGYYSKQGEGEDLDEEIMPAQDVLGSLQKSSMISSQNASNDIMDNDGHEAYVKISGGKDDSSNAGSSGWSSHGGMSSIDTTSVDDESNSAFSVTEMGGMSLAAMGAASHASVFRSRSSQSEGDEDDTDMDRSADDITMTYSELDRAISKGDWAAVGVSAALLASSQSYDTKSLGTTESSSKTPLRSTIDAKRAAELDRLVEAGDWEGVVKAAAKYDQQGEPLNLANSSLSSVGSSTKLNTMSSVMQSFSSVLSKSSKGGSSVGSQSSKGSKSRSLGEESAGSGTGLSAFTSQTGDSPGSGGRSAFTSQTGDSGGRSAFTSQTGGTTLSQAKKREEIRDEVEALVRRVVPEEVDNIDEMMAQFQGREEELVETLRTMQERAVAQKARLAGQKQAKRQAKQMVEDKAEPSTLAAVAASGGKPGAADDSWIKEIDQTPAKASASSGLLGPPKEEDSEQMEHALRSAIEAGDWEAVATTAEKISVFDDGTQGGSSYTSTSGSDPTQELNALVDKGDWEGVVKAASKFNEPGSKDETEAERRTRRARRLRDEQEALAQADIWDAIAEQAKSEAAQPDTGASDAADWAIARSLSALVKATEDGTLQDSADHLDAHAEEDEDNGEEDEDDRESV